MALGHELNTKIVSEEIRGLVRIELGTKAVDADYRRTDDDSGVIPIAVEIVRQYHTRSDGDALTVGRR